METPIFLLRYDTECPDSEIMSGFLEAVIKRHKAGEIPITLFCTGETLNKRRHEFHTFWDEVRDSGYIDVQDHSYSHIGVGYEESRALAVIQADYQHSFAVHEDVFGKRPIGVALCGVSDSGRRLNGLDEIEKSRQELAMLAYLGIKIMPARLTSIGRGQFCSYAEMGYSDIMGYPSAESDTEWLWNKDPKTALSYVKKVVDEYWELGQHGSLIMHDWCQWQFGSDKELGLVQKIADYIREKGFRLATVSDCYHNETLWRDHI
ncbi:MAG: hypothetical protein MK193_12250 [Lentisphaeria bacterium]|nr:hypothetical protein [Lentisphaeria bacterium]